MRSSFNATTGLKLSKSPGIRQQTARRRLAVLGSILGLALVSALVGALTTSPGGQESAGRTGPFSYFPSE